MTDHDEILRLRTRCDALEREVLGLGYLTKSQGRGIGGLRDELRTLQTRVLDLERTVANMNHAEQITASVTAALDASRRRQWGAWQKLGAGALAVMVALPTAVQIIHWFS